MSTLDDILDRTRDEVPPPVPTPNGTWKFELVGVAAIAPKGDNGAKVLYIYRPDSAEADVNTDALAAWAPQAESAKVFVRRDLGTSRDEAAVWKQLELAGVKSDGKKLGEVMKAIKPGQGHYVMGYLEYGKLNEDGLPFENIKNLAAVA